MKRVLTSSVRSKVVAAEGDKKPALDLALDNLNDDFDYVMSGLEKLGRSGASEENDALIIAEHFSDAIQQVLKHIADKVSQ